MTFVFDCSTKLSHEKQLETEKLLVVIAVYCVF